ncbi:MAG TPA: alkaline phosphatase family protein [Candidatus Polarisedimenticolia bacterium]|nr:alkaline phosphatase family protein [Candidatus Polarisedimenticolia bacterium]
MNDSPSLLARGAAGFAALMMTAVGCRSPRTEAARPKLIVLLAIDQLRADLLDRYDSLFTGGFRRLRDKGIRFTNTTVDHAITISHPGHVTLATGMVPARHGIVDAAFFEGPPGQRRLVDALEDPQEKILGSPDEKGVSPWKILVPTFPEWMAKADSRSREVALGSGRFSSLLHAGHLRGDVYWYSIPAGRYVTSSYYRREYPDWLERFNRDALPRFQKESSPWEDQVSESGHSLAVPDAVLFEADHVHVAFPHRLEDVAPADRIADPKARDKALAWWIATTPALDAATLALARESVRALSLGQRESTDYLAIVASQVDDIGHWYGPFSLEQLDNLLRLDREMGEFFTFLDEAVGEGKYLVALSADHGAPNIPEVDRESGRYARRLSEKEIQAALDAADKMASAAPGTPAEIAQRVADTLNRYDFVSDAMTPETLGLPGGSCDPYTQLFRNSFRVDRVPRFPFFSFSHEGQGVGRYGVVVRLTRGTMPDFDPSVHGSPYEVDRNVPLLFMGTGVIPGLSDVRARTVDVAPTLARLAGIPVPPDLDGRPLILTSGR